jgi:hypothetical protein
MLLPPDRQWKISAVLEAVQKKGVPEPEYFYLTPGHAFAYNRNTETNTKKRSFFKGGMKLC